MFKNLGNLGSMLKQAQEIRGRMQDMQQNLGRIRVEGSAGGGMVRVEATGQQNLTAFHIDPSLLESPDRELLEELLLSAANQALEKARTAAADELSKITGGFDIPGLSNALGLGGAGNTVPE